MGVGMKIRSYAKVVVITCGLFVFLFSGFGAAKAESPQKPKLGLALPSEKWEGDLDGMVKRRMIRVLVVYSKTFFFVDKGTQRGISYDVFRKFEEELNRKLKTQHMRVNVVFIPVSRDELLPALSEGKGDIAAANLTITGGREKLVDFTDPLLTEVNEIVVTGPESPQIATIDDLSGQEVFVRHSSSYFESLTALNERFKKEGKSEVKLLPTPENLEDEDLLEMLNAGLIKLLVVDSHKALFWKQIFPDLTVHADIAVRSGGSIAWAIRENSPQLKAELNEFVKKNGQSTAFGSEIFRLYLKSARYVKNAASSAEMKKFRELVQFFRKYGDTYGMDWVLMAAQGYQESRLDQNAKSPVGAVGVMQVMPATGKELKVGDIRLEEPNIHAGVKYIRFMVDQYFKDEPMDNLNKGLFAFAAYNAGPGRVRQLRKAAQKRGLNPNVWFNNVELVAAEKIGRETVTYVSNIYKYYIAYKLSQQKYIERRETKEQFEQQ
ncbi:MAG: lytic transglycosylase F [Deltaproteobacteria bacterium]|nr:MAG: lytic transglycosylase F [Deltaproteobacteria bacterium]